MYFFPDISTALQLLEHIQHTIDSSDDVKLQTQTADDLNLLISVLENPIFRSIVTIQVPVQFLETTSPINFWF